MGTGFIAIIAASILVSANFGYFLIACLAFAMASATMLGRYWCNWFCPRGSFLEFFLSKASRRKTFPVLFKKRSFFASVVAIFMFMMALNFLLLYPTYSVIDALGVTLTRLLVISTIVAIILGVAYEPRAWCSFCPGATFAKLAAGFESKRPYLVNSPEKCVSCGACSKKCMFHIDASKHGIIDDSDCVKCSTCINNCPAKALRFAETL